MLPLYKVFSIVMRALTRPAIGLLKQRPPRPDGLAYRTLIRCGRLWVRVHQGQTKLAHAEPFLLEKGSQFCAEFIVYTILIAIPLLELSRKVKQTEQKEEEAKAALQAKFQKVRALNDRTQRLLDQSKALQGTQHLIEGVGGAVASRIRQRE